MAEYSQPRKTILGEPLAALFALRAARGVANGGSIRGVGYRMRDILRTATELRATLAPDGGRI